MSKQKILNLPQVDELGIPYISYSQYTKWKKSKRDYIRHYFLGDKFTGNAYTEFGTKVGEALEHNDFSAFTEEEEEFLKTIPRYDEFETEVKLQMNGFYIKGYIDTNIKPTDYKDGKGGRIKTIADYKTGDVETKRAEYESDDYKQLHIYGAYCKQKYGHLPDECLVFLIDRKGNAFRNEELLLGRDFTTIIKNVDEDSVKTTLDDVQSVAEEISEYYTLFLKMNKII